VKNSADMTNEASDVPYPVASHLVLI